jgi:iron complex transport system substrate-binding protein
VDRVVAAIPHDERPVVFFGGTAEPIYSVGPGSFVDDLIRRAGGRNVFRDIGSSWPRVDLETLISRNPDVVLLSFQRMGGADKTRDELRTAPGWRALDAVRAGRVYTIGDEAQRPGPRVIDALEVMHRAIIEHTAVTGRD